MYIRRKAVMLPKMYIVYGVYAGRSVVERILVLQAMLLLSLFSKKKKLLSLWLCLFISHVFLRRLTVPNFY